MARNLRALHDAALAVMGRVEAEMQVVVVRRPIRPRRLGIRATRTKPMASFVHAIDPNLQPFLIPLPEGCCVTERVKTTVAAIGGEVAVVALLEVRAIRGKEYPLAPAGVKGPDCSCTVLEWRSHAVQAGPRCARWCAQKDKFIYSRRAACGKKISIRREDE